FLILVFSPFVLVTFGSSLLRLIDPSFSTQFKPGALSQALPRKIGQPRVVWIIFDELEYGQAFDHRSSSVDLPELDRFRQDSISASAAYPPAYSTAISVPALVTGQLLESTAPSGANELL